MKVFAIIALVLAVGYFGFARYQQLEKAKIEAAEAARIAAAEEKHRSDLALRVAEEERKRQDEEDSLIAAEERFRASQQQKSLADAAQKNQQAVVDRRHRHHREKPPQHSGIKLADAGFDDDAGRRDIQHQIGASFYRPVVEQTEFLAGKAKAHNDKKGKHISCHGKKIMQHFGNS